MLNLVKKIPANSIAVYIVCEHANLESLNLTEKASKALKKSFKEGQKVILEKSLENPANTRIIAYVKHDEKAYKTRENARLVGVDVNKLLNQLKAKTSTLVNLTEDISTLDFAEGLILSNYQFLKYRQEAAKEKYSLQKVNALDSRLKKANIDEFNTLIEAVFIARTLVNEPLNFLTAPQIAKEFQKMGKEAGFKVSVWNKSKIEKEGFGGLLAVNYGSVDPPTFSIMEWKPAKAVNKKPIVLVGKGIVYDTGGLSLKPTENSMDHMKCDMGGAAAVSGAIYAVAKNKLPVHVIALVPATDNRPGLNAYAPGDVIKMHSGHTVEVLNTDAEGRMVMADALSYAKRYKPELVMDMATLTGAALRAVGQFGSVIMGTADENQKNNLKESGFETFERVIEFPFWDDYKNLLKSDIADFKNIGGSMAGAITAGKFLEHFTDYPWIHIDIAPVAWQYSPNAYRPKNGSGYGVRLVYDFIKRHFAV